MKFSLAIPTEEKQSTMERKLETAANLAANSEQLETNNKIHSDLVNLVERRYIFDGCHESR